MGHAWSMEKDIFADVMEKIRSLTEAQQRFLQEMLAGREKDQAVSDKELLRNSFCIWANRKDIKGHIEYVEDVRKGWESCLEIEGKGLMPRTLLIKTIYQIKEDGT